MITTKVAMPYTTTIDRETAWDRYSASHPISALMIGAVAWPLGMVGAVIGGLGLVVLFIPALALVIVQVRGACVTNTGTGCTI